jgi:hypothetical protein
MNLEIGRSTKFSFVNDVRLSSTGKSLLGSSNPERKNCYRRFEN